MASLKNLDLLICDEWGHVSLDKESAQLIFWILWSVLSRRSVDWEPLLNCPKKVGQNFIDIHNL